MRTTINKVIKTLMLVGILISIHQLQSIAQASSNEPTVTLRVIDSKIMEDGSSLDIHTTYEGNFSDEEIRAYIDEAPQIDGLVERQVDADIQKADGSIEKRKYRWRGSPVQGMVGTRGRNQYYFNFENLDKFEEMIPELQERFKQFEFSIPDIEITIDDEMFKMPHGLMEFELEDMPYFINSNKAFLGVYTEGNTDSGVSVLDVVEGSPAEMVGLQKGDVVLMVDDEEITNPEHLTKIISAKAPGDEVILTILREGNSLKQAVVLDKRKSNIQEIRERDIFKRRGQPSLSEQKIYEHKGQWPFSKDKKSSKKSLLGVTVREMDNYEGLKVLDVEADSPAAIAGIQIDDVIVKFDKKKVESPAHLKSLVADKAGEEVQIELRKSKKKRKVKVHIESTTK